MLTTHSIEFAIRYQYLSLQSGIWLPAALMIGERVVDCEAKVDTGDELEITVEAGEPMRLVTVMGALTAYAHWVTLHTLGLAFESLVYFVAMQNFPRNLLGCHGWLNRIKFGVIDYEQCVYLRPYDSIQ